MKKLFMNYFIVPGLKIRPQLIKKAKVANYDPKIIINAVTEYFNTNIEMLLNKRRFTYIVEQRHSLQYILMRYSPLSCKAIGEMFGQDHSTILHARDTVINELDSVLENNFKKYIPELLNKIRYEIKEIELPSYIKHQNIEKQIKNGKTHTIHQR